MTGWILIVGLAIVIMAVLVFVVKIPRTSWEFVAAALMLGLAGYAWQGNAGYAGAPKSAAESFTAAEREYQELRIAQRKRLDYEFSGARGWLIFADGQARKGNYQAAAIVLANAIEQHPENSDLWVALGNVLDSASEGMISPAATYAYRRAAAINPKDPRPAFDMALALAQSGKLEEARAIWAELLQNNPKDEAIRASASAGVARVDAMLGSREPDRVLPPRTLQK